MVEGTTGSRLIGGAMDGTLFTINSERFLAPTLSQGDIVILANLPAQRVAGTRAAIEAAGATHAVPPAYSPDFNPIEKVFAKIKALLRQAAARTVDTRKRYLRRAQRVQPTRMRKLFYQLRI